MFTCLRVYVSAVVGFVMIAKVIILLSGKRKSGKDYVAALLHKK